MELAKFEKKNMVLFQELADVSKMKKAIEQKESEAKEKLLEAMEKNGIVSIDNDIIQISYIAGTESVALDSKALKLDDPNLFHKLMDKYNKRTTRKPYLRFKAK